MQIEKQNTDYQQLVSQISDIFVQGQRQSVVAVNAHLVTTYWKVGQYIVEYEQKGNDSQSVVAKYKLYLPDKEDFKKIIHFQEQP
ncbi:MAG: hypothetical protein LBB85_01145 [Dysgonamonadaceae bacterium]|jgi:hypothetical protein|nr:hypothetical protein [Dysgonamonadaceae bacterium]